METTEKESGFRLRLRFRISKSFGSTNTEESVSIDGHNVTFRSTVRDQPLNQAIWMVAIVDGFASETDGWNYGTKLRRAIQFASIVSRSGVDCGKDRPTSRWGLAVKESLREMGANLLDDVHGIDVYKNDGTAMLFTVNGQLQVHQGMAGFLDKLAEFYPWMDKVNPKVDRIVILLNNVLMNPEPVAQIVLAISTIEGLGQDQEFTSQQRSLINQLASQALLSEDCSGAEADEVSEAIRKLHKLSLRQGVLRLLKNAELDLKREWDSIYAERSKLVHGLAPEPGIDYRDLAHRTVALCVTILNRLIELEIGSEQVGGLSLVNYPI